MRRVLPVLAAFAASFLARAGDVVLPDIRGGNVGGKAALLYWPASMPADAAHDPQPLPSAEGCEVHLVPHSDFNQELRQPCGKWFAPPAGRYNLWLETDGGITPNPVMATYSASPFAGQGLAAIVPLMTAGRVAIPAERAMPEQEGLRIVSIEAGDWWNRGARVFDRRIAARDAKTPVRMPAGRVIVGRFDRVTNDAIALSRPVEVKAGRTSLVWPVPPVASDVLVVLDKPAVLQRQHSGASRLALHDGRTSRAPDVVLDAFERIIAIWYGVDARLATISVQSETAFWQPREVRLLPGKVTTVRSRLEGLPSVEVSVNAPPDAQLPEEMSLAVSRPSEQESLRRVPIAAGVHRVDAVPAERLRFTLQVGDWKLARDVDLASGADASMAFDLQPIVISGTVFYGDERAPAEIAFFNGGDWTASVRTNERGEYRTTLWWPKSHSMRLTLVGRDVPPFVDSFREIFESGTVDFHIPRTDYSVRVRDASTGRGVANARVTAGNTWLDEESGEHSSAVQAFTNEDGLAVLPPLQAGEVVVEARAERYAEGKTFRARVDKEHHEIEVALRPLRVARRVQLSLANGLPAAQAEVWAFDPAMQPVWRGVTESDGRLEIPEAADGMWLLIRHAGAASAVRRWSASDASEAWQLDAPAEPLTLIVERAGGRQASGAHVVLWLDGVKLSGVPLTFATWSTPATNPAGVWVGRNLPARPLRVLALAAEAAGAIGSNAFDAVGRRVDYPWPVPVNATTPE